MLECTPIDLNNFNNKRLTPSQNKMTDRAVFLFDFAGPLETIHARGRNGLYQDVCMRVAGELNEGVLNISTWSTNFVYKVDGHLPEAEIRERCVRSLVSVIFYSRYIHHALSDPTNSTLQAIFQLSTAGRRCLVILMDDITHDMLPQTIQDCQCVRWVWEQSRWQELDIVHNIPDFRPFRWSKSKIYLYVDRLIGK
jgi:hypothetical protein